METAAPPAGSWSSLSLEDISRETAAMGQPEYRARQLFKALHQQGIWAWDGLTTWPTSLRETASSRRPLRALAIGLDLRSQLDDTRKVLFETVDGHQVESVLMRSSASSQARHAVCVSSQVGCPAACSFCASGLAGLARNLTAAEIVDQVEFFAAELRRQGSRLDNVVYMGMGEPFLNFRRVMDSIRALRSGDGLGLGARRITVSTVGIVPGIRRFTQEAGEVNLAISLHAPNDDLRSRLVPYNRHFPLDAVLGAALDYTKLTRRRISFEYVLLDGTNDGPQLAVELSNLMRPFGPLAHVNLIPWNPFAEVSFGRARDSRVEAFADAIRRRGTNVTIRHSKGLDIDAACGQLRDRALQRLSA